MGNICWIASYPKSGNTWMRAFIANYLENGPRPVDLNVLHARYPAEASAFRFAPHAPGGDSLALGLEELCALRTPVQAEMAARANGTLFVKTHNIHGAYRGYPLHNATVTSGAVVIVRNPLDVAVSLSHYFAFTIDDAIDYMAQEMTGTLNEAENVAQVISSWSLNVASWSGEPNPSVLVLRYEDLLDKPLKVFRKVVNLLGLPRDDQRLKKAVQFTSFKQLQSQERSGGFAERHEDARQFFRSGRHGQWRTELGREQVERVIRDHGEQMARFRYLPPGYR